MTTVPLRGHTGKILSAEFSSDGRYVLTAGDTSARLWEAATGRTVAVLGHHGVFLLDASFSPDGRRVVTAGADTTARVWDVHAAGGELILSGHRDRVYDASFSDDGEPRRHREPRRHGQDLERAHRRVREDVEPGWRRARRRLRPGRRRHRHRRRVGREALRPARRPSLSGIPAGDVDVRADGTVSSPVSTEERARSAGSLEERSGAGGDDRRLHPGSDEILTAGGEGVEIWSATTLGLIGRLKYAPAILYSALFSSDGKHIATASSDGTARIFDAHPAINCTPSRWAPSSRAPASAPDPEGRLLVTLDKDGAVRVWDTNLGALEEFFTDHTDVPVWNASFSPDGTRVVSASSDGTAHVYRLTPIDELLTLARARLRATVTPELERTILSQP